MANSIMTINGLKKNWGPISFIIIGLILFIGFIKLLGINLNVGNKNKVVKKVITVEGFEPNEEPNEKPNEKPNEEPNEKTDKKTSLNSNSNIYSDGLCDKYSSQPHILDKHCNDLTETNCKATSCCGWLNSESCVAGDKSGPTFQSINGKEIITNKWEFKQ